MKREYPTRLLPQLNYVNDIKAKGLPIDKFFVQRNTENNVPIHDLYELQENLGDHMQESRYRGGLSMNLVGIYLRNDSRYVVDYKKYGQLKEDWSQAVCSIRPRYSGFKYRKNAGYFGFLIADVLSIKKKLKLKNAKKEAGEYEVYFIIEHKPTRSNYWHVEFHLYGNCLEKEGESGKLNDLAEKNIISKGQVDRVGSMMTKEFRGILKIRNKIIQYHIPKHYYID